MTSDLYLLEFIYADWKSKFAFNVNIQRKCCQAAYSQRGGCSHSIRFGLIEQNLFVHY